MNVSSWSIRNPVPALLLFILLAVFGVIGFSKLQVQDFPDTDMPQVTISASLEGAAPSQLETEVARKIEDKLASLTLLDHITTTVTDGAVNITVTFTLDKDSEVAVNEVRNAVDSARADLPAQMSSPTVSKMTAAASSLLSYTVSSEQLDEQDLPWFVDNDLSKALRAVSGVASVSRLGGVDREILIELDPVLMAGLGVTPADVSTRLKEVQRELSGGQAEIGGQRQSARMIATVGSVEEVAQISLPLADGRWLRLDQIARIHDGHAERANYAIYDGERVVGFSVTRSRGFSDLVVVDDVREKLADFAAANPQVTITEVSNTIDPVVDNYHGSMMLLVEGAILAILVVYCFLRSWRSTFIAAVALPLSILPTFACMWLAGYSLNTVTLLSLALVVGVLVDDAIVEVENIERHLHMGKTPYQAAMEAADEIGLAVVATTFTLVAVFLPTAFMGGISGQIFRQFGITASVAVLASLLVARLLTPMMAAYLLKPHSAQTAEPVSDGPIMQRYLGLARSALLHRRSTLLAATVFFVVCSTLALFIPTAFIPAQDKAQSSLTLTLDPDSTLENTEAVVLRALELVEQVPEVRSVFALVGSSSSGDMMNSSSLADVTTATLTVDLVPRGERALKQSEVEAKLRVLLRGLAGVRVAVGGGGNGEVLELTLASDDAQALLSSAEQLEEQLRTLSGVGNVTSSAALQRSEVQIRPDYAAAAYLGVTSQALGDAVRLATYGDYSTELPKLNLPQRQVSIRARMASELRDDLDAIAQLRVLGRDGLVSLGSIADISMGSAPAQIDRIDRMRNVTLSVELNGRALALPADAKSARCGAAS